MPTIGHNKLVQRAPAVASGVLALLLAADVAGIALALHPATLTAGPVATPYRPLVRTPRANIRTILAAHLFGLSASDPAAPTAVASGLSAHLTGTIAVQSAPERGMAMFETADSTQHIVTVGNPIEPGRILVAVYADHIELDHAGVRETLAMPRTLKRVQKYVASVAPADPRSLEERVEHTAGNYSRFLRPVDSDNPKVFRGVEIADSAEAQGLSTLGLHTGDKVVMINGVRVTTPDALAELSTGGTVALGIQNDNGYHVVRVDATLLR